MYHSPFRGGSCSGTGDRIGPSEHRQSESFAAVGLNRGWRLVVSKRVWRLAGGNLQQSAVAAAGSHISHRHLFNSTGANYFG